MPTRGAPRPIPPSSSSRRTARQGGRRLHPRRPARWRALLDRPGARGLPRRGGGRRDRQAMGDPEFLRACEGRRSRRACEGASDSEARARATAMIAPSSARCCSTPGAGLEKPAPSAAVAPPPIPAGLFAAPPSRSSPCRTRRPDPANHRWDSSRRKTYSGSYYVGPRARIPRDPVRPAPPARTRLDRRGAGGRDRGEDRSRAVARRRARRPDH